MFFYRFGDQYTHNIYQSQHNSKSWDLVYFNNHHYLNLWEEISRPEQGSIIIHFTWEKIIYKFCNSNTIIFLHRMVNERFSSYNKCIPLFFWNNIQVLLKYKIINRTLQSIDNWNSSFKNKSQSLFVLPSVLSITQYLRTRKQELWISVLTGQSTTIARAKTYRAISNNTTQIFIATHSQIFQNRHNLKHITIVDPYSPLYQTYHDPRYNIYTIIQKLSEIYKIIL